MKAKFTLSCLLLLFTFFSQAQIRYLKGVLQASQSGPTVVSSGGGVVIVKYNTVTKLLEHYGNFRGLTTPITNQHIHTGAPGVNGPVTVPLTASPTGGTAGGLYGSMVLNAQQEADLLAGNMYTNVHSVMYGGGEIRAQLTLATDGQTELLNARLQGAQQVPPTGVLATGAATALIDKSTRMLYVTSTFTGLSAPASNAHVHRGAPHVSGPVIVPVRFTAAVTGSLDTAIQVSMAHMDSMLAGNTYINIHTPTFPDGEIRGQLTSLSQQRFLGGSLQGSQEVPPTATTGRGTVIVKYDPATKMLTLNGDYQNLTTAVTASHIHVAPPGTANPAPLFPLTNTGGTTGMLMGSAILNATQEADLLAGNMYTNVHTATYPDGELRAQLMPTSPFNSHYFMDTLEFAQSFPVPPVPSTGRGSSIVLLDRNSLMVYVTANFTGLTSNINNTHIHAGAAGTSGPVVVNLFFGGTTSGTVTGAATVPRASFADSMIRGLTYINIHTTLNTGGEIRGQLGDLVLPVKLSYFNGYKDKNQAVLVWQSAQEVDLSKYELQQQSANGDWLTKSTTLAKGGTASTRYQVNDVPFASASGFVFYRLKMVDKDGKFSYSPVVKLNIRKNQPELTIMQNPVVGTQVKFAITGLAADEKAEVSIVDMNGRAIYKKTSSSLANGLIQVGNLSSGLYKLVVRVQETVLQQTFSK
ncbi:CHRD domain-containing protein [Segetibacter sp. 3557_3]|uniref:CHRD domain-containing protein n=1 Tax=Segetibacter sp. 3557_3 TaxID=2547429 RepID=UPI00105909D8|nr:CHRD domain-containing protein [Segetibacter sp. 3557_3]TDH20880.1 CHRD domain-containing protein [Segetibacter sp. 3557_3]